MGNEDGHDADRLRKQWIDEYETVYRRSLPIIIDYSAGTRAYGEIAIRSSLLLNGGALFAFPPFIAILSAESSQLPMSLILSAATLFVTGVLSAALCALVVYLNQEFFLASEGYRRNRDLIKIRLRYDTALAKSTPLGKENDPAHQEDMRKRYFKWAKRLFWPSILAGIASYALFASGCYYSGKAILGMQLSRVDR